MDHSQTLTQKVCTAVQTLSKKIKITPTIAVIPGTGLGLLAEKVEDQVVVSYPDIPHFVTPTGIGHRGQLIFGKIEEKPVVFMEGRFHYYEGYTMEEVTFPIRVFKALGVQTLLITNVSGGLNPSYEAGDIILLEDHINFMGDHPLRGLNDEVHGPRFLDMYEPYDPDLLRLAEKIAREQGVSVQRGIYIGVPGPSLETRSEYKMFRAWGADCVGMSTVPEVLAARHSGLRVLALSVVTDLCYPGKLKPSDISEIVEIANRRTPVLAALVYALIRALPSQD